MRSNQPYLLRAFYDWIVDNQCTPYIIVDAFHEGTEVPQEFVKGGQIVLNIAPRAVTNFDMSGDASYAPRASSWGQGCRIPKSSLRALNTFF